MDQTLPYMWEFEVSRIGRANVPSQSLLLSALVIEVLAPRYLTILLTTTRMCYCPRNVLPSQIEQHIQVLESTAETESSCGLGIGR